MNHEDMSKNEPGAQDDSPSRILTQFSIFVDTQNALIESGACLLTGNTYQEDYEQYVRLVAHAEQHWEAARNLYAAGLFPQAVFLAITCVEETGKIGVARFQLAIRNAERETGKIRGRENNVRRKDNRDP